MQRAHSTLALAGIAAAFLYSCRPYETDGIELPEGPEADFSWAFVEGDSNRVVFTSNSNDGFLHLWEFGNGLTSTSKNDTAYYPQAGEYTVTYSVNNAGGMAQASQTISIANTLELPCEGALALLTGCDTQKTWVWSSAAGAISVGPIPYATEWYSSPAGGLVPEQYDDTYQFTFDGEYLYANNGGTVNPYEGYVVSALEVPALTYSFLEGTGTSGEDQIALPSCWFMGVWDSGPTYDIVELTEETLVLHGRIQNGDCTPGNGYFTLSFSAL
jgi:PKD repeat protein